MDMKMIPSSPSTTQSVVGGQVFWGATEDHAQGPNPHVEKVPSIKSLCAQTSEEGLTLILAIVEHMAAFVEKLVKRTHGGEADLNLVVVFEHVARMLITLVSCRHCQLATC